MRAISRRTQQQQDEQHGKVLELQVALERSKDGYEETLTRLRADKAEREVKLLQTDAELDRLRSAVASRDARIDELEQLQQSGRLRALELKDRLDQDERTIQELRTQIEIEQSQKARLESKLRALSALGAEPGSVSDERSQLTSRSNGGGGGGGASERGHSGRDRMR